MDSIVNEAKKYAIANSEMGSGIFGGPQITVCGSGGAGNNTA